MGRQPCCQKVGIKKGPWTAKEDKKLVDFILTNGHCCWRTLPKLAGLLRCGQSCMLCMLRWTNYLRPDLKRGLLSESEEKMVINLHSQLGNRWSKIASHLPDRTDNEIKTHIKKILRKMGIDPLTHKPISPTSPYIDEHEGPAKLSDDKKHEKRFDDTINIQSPQTVTEQMVQEFDLSEVPMIQPNELMAPSLTSSSTTTNSCSNSSSTTNAEESQLPCNIDWKESMHMWGLDDTFMEWGSFSIYMQPAPVDFALIKSHESLSSFDFI